MSRSPSRVLGVVTHQIVLVWKLRRHTKEWTVNFLMVNFVWLMERVVTVFCYVGKVGKYSVCKEQRNGSKVTWLDRLQKVWKNSLKKIINKISTQFYFCVGWPGKYSWYEDPSLTYKKKKSDSLLRSLAIPIPTTNYSTFSTLKQYSVIV